jgi:hypothetical protein
MALNYNPNYFKLKNKVSPVLNQNSQEANNLNRLSWNNYHLNEENFDRKSQNQLRILRPSSKDSRSRDKKMELISKNNSFNNNDNHAKFEPHAQIISQSSRIPLTSGEIQSQQETISNQKQALQINPESKIPQNNIFSIPSPLLHFPVTTNGINNYTNNNTIANYNNLKSQNSINQNNNSQNQSSRLRSANISIQHGDNKENVAPP